MGNSFLIVKPFLKERSALLITQITNQSIIVWAMKAKSLLPSSAYRQAGFTKGRNSPSLEKRG